MITWTFGAIIFIRKGIFPDSQEWEEITENIVKEVAVAPSDEVKELDKEGVQEDTENGSKGIEKMNDEEDDVIDTNTYFDLVWACEFS